MMRLFSWAENSYEPLQSYATGLLAAAMDVQDIANGYRYRYSSNRHLEAFKQNYFWYNSCIIFFFYIYFNHVFELLLYF